MVGEDLRPPLPWLGPTLAQAFAHPAHALLLVAPPGAGALDLQTTLAQAWLCEGEVRDGLPCGRCTSCRLMQSHTHPDLKLLLPGALALERGWATEDEVTRGGKRKPSKWILVDDVRDALDWVTTTRSRDRAKVVLLHPADAMQGVVANALLKSLEEPPHGVRWLLSCADPERLLPTVRSRCQRIVMPVPEPSMAQGWLAEQGVQSPETLLAACAGRPLDARALHAAGVDAAAWAALPSALARGQAGAWSGWPLSRAVDALQKLCHDLLAQATGAAPRYFPSASLPKRAGAVAPLLDWAAELRRVSAQVDHPWNEALALEALVGRGRDALATLPR